MRWLAKGAKLAPAFGSKRPIASSRPSVPAWIRSSSSTPDGSFTCKASAWRRTAGRCCFSNSFWSIFPCAVYILGRGQERLGFADIIVTWAHYGRVRGSGCRDKAPIPAAFWVIEIARRASSSVVHQQLDGAHLHGRAFPPRQTETELQRRAGGLAGQRIAGTTTPLHRHAAPVHAQFGSEGAAGRQLNAPSHAADGRTGSHGRSPQRRAGVDPSGARHARTRYRVAPASGCGQRRARPQRHDASQDGADASTKAHAVHAQCIAPTRVVTRKPRSSGISACDSTASCDSRRRRKRASKGRSAGATTSTDGSPEDSWRASALAVSCISVSARPGSIAPPPWIA